MQTVFSDHSQCAHVWAQRSQPRGKADNIFFEDDTIYSYGSHFPIATFIGDKVIFNIDSYSISTTQHKSIVRSAASQYEFIYTDTDTLKTLASWKKSLEGNNRREAKQHITGHIARAVEEKITRAAQCAAEKRMKKSKAAVIDGAASYFRQQQNLLAYLGCKMPTQTARKLATLQTDYQGIIAAANREQAAKQRAWDKKQAEHKAATGI